MVRFKVARRRELLAGIGRKQRCYLRNGASDRYLRRQKTGLRAALQAATGRAGAPTLVTCRLAAAGGAQAETGTLRSGRHGQRQQQRLQRDHISREQRNKAP